MFSHAFKTLIISALSSVLISVPFSVFADDEAAKKFQNNLLTNGPPACLAAGDDLTNPVNKALVAQYDHALSETKMGSHDFCDTLGDLNKLFKKTAHDWATCAEATENDPSPSAAAFKNTALQFGMALHAEEGSLERGIVQSCDDD